MATTDFDLWKRLVGYTIIESETTIKGGELTLLIEAKRSTTYNGSWEEMKNSAENIYLITVSNVTSYVSKPLYDMFKKMDVIKQLTIDENDKFPKTSGISKKRKKLIVSDQL